MAGKIGIRIKKNVGGGLRGSTSGLRFNPREAPEFAEEDRNLGRDDPEAKQRHQEKKEREKEKRDKKISGLKHLNIKSRNKRGARGDNARNDEELSEMTGPASSTGYPLDVATGAKTGGGSAMGGPNIMTGEPMTDAFDYMIKKKEKEGEGGLRPVRESYPLRPHPPFKTVMGKPGEKPSKDKKDPDIQRYKYSPGEIKGPKRLRVEGKKPPLLSRIHASAKKILSPITRAGGFFPFLRRLTKLRFRGYGQPKVGDSPLSRGKAVIQQAHQRDIPAESQRPGNVQQPFTTVKKQKRVANVGGRGESALIHSKALRQTKTASTPLGAAHTAASSLASGSSMTASPIDLAASEDAIPWAEDLLRKKDLTQSDLTEFKMLIRQVRRLLNSKAIKRSEEISYDLDGLLMKGSLTQADLTEFKMLVRELRALLRSGALHKAGLEDAEHDDERPTPNAHRKTTSSPTGATSIDPDDDPRYWGAHPIGLLAPRRGHQ